ncbi:MAG: alpha-galactosidase, partial [Lachnospiraceae bacterium]|nr:alpha-galactosidase [Lachnospiraceae bacterium]
MIKHENNIFELHTNNSSLVLEAAQNGQLLMLFYGKRIEVPGDGIRCPLSFRQEYATGNTISYEDDNLSFAQEDYCFAVAGNGKGDVRESLYEITDKKGFKTFDFKYDGFEILKKKPCLGQMPSAYGESETLVISLKDSFHKVLMKLNFTVFEDTDVITRSTVLINESENDFTVNKLLSNLTDFDRNDFTVMHFHGSWASEMNEENTPVSSAGLTLGSRTGTSSSRCNPLFFLKASDCTLDHGEVYGFNLVYSGDHFAGIQCDHFGRTRVVNGLSPFNFSYALKPGDSLYSPEAVLAYSDEGLNGITDVMHRFVNEHIVRGAWKNKERPILINSWEASYFNFTENSLLRLAKEAAVCGIELFVLDDGWFGERDSDSKSLGDWVVNKKKLPGGLKSFAEKLKAMGLKFGIWVEPEMVNEDSDLYRAHPEWAIKAPEASHSKGRNQMILDLTNPKVREYIIDSMTEVFSSADISYVKWDMNRNFSDYYSNYLEGRQGELGYRYYEGFYS